MKRILVLGSTGYVGTRLVQHLLQNGFLVRAGWRTKSKLERCPWYQDTRVEAVCVDVTNKNEVRNAMEDCSSVFYLVHSMYSGKTFGELDRTAAENVTDCAGDVGVERVIYLGGLGEEGDKLSEHLRSRTEVDKILRSGSAPVTTLRAAMIIGAGSASFEIMRYLVDRLPVMVTPRWVRTKTQPIAITNVLEYLVGCLSSVETVGETLDIGGPVVTTYSDLMREYARIARLPRRIVVPIPVLSPKLSSYWVDLVSPLPASIARPLVEGLSQVTVCKDNRIRELIPQDLFSIRKAIHLALSEIEYNLTHGVRQEKQFVPEWTQSSDPDWAGGTVFRNRKRVVVECDPQTLWHPVSQIGGPTGWYYANWVWQVYGLIDELIGGVGIRRGRDNCSVFSPGDVVDCWRVIDVDPPRYLKLYAEMKIPARATLELHIRQKRSNKTELIQDVTFVPRGLPGHIYWYSTLPFHNHLWLNMLKSISRKKE